jgi:predicted amidophosphoribosyltransferase
VDVIELFSELRALVVPPLCVACRAPLGAGGEVLCATCRRGLPWLRGELCRRCGLPVPCRPCPARRAGFERAWAPLAHQGAARRVVAALKFDARLAVADAMAAQLATGVPDRLLGGSTLVPVPAEPRRRRAQGYGHTEVLAQRFARRTGVEVLTCLRREVDGHRQLGAARSARLAPGRIAIEATGRAPPSALLVDDVHTTGATLDACARALRAAGARSVTAITYTRALRR